MRSWSNESVDEYLDEKFPAPKTWRERLPSLPRVKDVKGFYNSHRRFEFNHYKSKREIEVTIFRSGLRFFY